MNGKKFFDALSKALKTTSNKNLARAIGKFDSQVSAMKAGTISELTMARIVASQAQQIVRAEVLIQELKNRFNVKTDSALSEKLGTTQQTLVNWKKSSKGLSAQQLADMVAKANHQAARDANQKAFRPIIEFFPIDRSLKKKNFDVFDASPNCGKQRTGLKKELENSHGLYIFYDVRGKALYVGQATEQSLWKEMHSAYNRDRGAQTIATVKHPKNNIAYKPAHEKLRQPVDTSRKLVDLASYFSAYDVTVDLIDDFEALFIRAFPNDLLNYKMEKIGKKKAIKKKGRTPKK